MSIALMTLAWKADLPSGRKMVLLALCDNANDQGECFPSVPMLAEKCSMGERTVQQHIADMEEAGIVTREMRAGRSTIYRIDPRKFRTPAKSASPQISHLTPAESAPSPPQISHLTPADIAPITIKEPSIEPLGKHQKRDKAVKDEFDPIDALLEAGVDDQTAKDWVQHRKTKKFSYSMTVIKDRKKQAAEASMTLDAALSMEVSRGWQGFEAAWVNKPHARGSPYQSRNDRSGAAAAIFGPDDDKGFIDVN